MTLMQNKNKTSWNSTQNDKYAMLVVFRFLSYLCIAGLFVLLGYMYINLNRQNRNLDSMNSHLLAEYATLTVQLQNLKSELEQKGNIQLVSKAPELNLQKATTAQIYILDGPVPNEFVQEGGSMKETPQVARK